jgi:hypothetical protein
MWRSISPPAILGALALAGCSARAANDPRLTELAPVAHSLFVAASEMDTASLRGMVGDPSALEVTLEIQRTDPDLIADGIRGLTPKEFRSCSRPIAAMSFTCPTGVCANGTSSRCVFVGTGRNGG